MHEIKILCEDMVTSVNSQDPCILTVNYIFLRDTKTHNTDVLELVLIRSDPIRSEIQELITAKKKKKQWIGFWKKKRMSSI